MALAENTILTPLTDGPSPTPYLNAIENSLIDAGRAANIMMNQPSLGALKNFKQKIGEVHLLASNVVKKHKGKVDPSKKEQEDPIKTLLDNADAFMKFDMTKMDLDKDGELFREKVNEGYDLYVSYNDTLITLKKIRT